MPKTLYISDLDGTLLNADVELSEYTKNVLNELAAGEVYFSVATARTFETVKYILEGVKLNMPIILLNGVLIYDTERNEYINRCSLSSEAVGSVVQILNNLGVTGLMYELNNDKLLTYYEDFASRPILDFVEEQTIRYNKIFKKSGFSEVPTDDIIYFTLLDRYEKIIPVKDAFVGAS